MFFPTCSVELITGLLIFSGIALTCPLSSANYVHHLPGFNGTFSSRLETGYVTVDKSKGTELFYYFVESEREPTKDPVLLWLTGGPGCSSFFGFSQESGPLTLTVSPNDANAPHLSYNPHRWTKISSIIYLDWPSGSGFSYSKTTDIILDDTSTADQVYYFLKQWFLDHPQFLPNPFYAFGESYGGKIAILVAHRISKENEETDHILINLEGILVGNSRTGVNKFDINSRVPKAHGLGVISDELLETIQKHCVGEDYLHPVNSHCQANLKVFNEIFDELWTDNILKPKCTYAEAIQQLLQPTDPDTICWPIIYHHLSSIWENTNSTRTMLGVKEETVEKWSFCNYDLKGNYSEDIPSILPHIYHLLSRGYRALVYSGDHDLTFPFTGTREWIKTLNLTTLKYWRSWHSNGQVAGYTETYSLNLTFATVKGAGHEAIEDKPAQCYAMFERWIARKPL